MELLTRKFRIFAVYTLVFQNLSSFLNNVDILNCLDWEQSVSVDPACLITSPPSRVATNWFRPRRRDCQEQLVSIQNLDKIFAPHRIAVFGASNNHIERRVHGTCGT